MTLGRDRGQQRGHLLAIDVRDSQSSSHGAAPHRQVTTVGIGVQPCTSPLGCPAGIHGHALLRTIPDKAHQSGLGGPPPTSDTRTFRYVIGDRTGHRRSLADTGRRHESPPVRVFERAAHRPRRASCRTRTSSGPSRLLNLEGSRQRTSVRPCNEPRRPPCSGRRDYASRPPRRGLPARREDPDAGAVLHGRRRAGQPRHVARRPRLRHALLHH